MKRGDRIQLTEAAVPEQPLVARMRAMQRFCVAARVIECLLLGSAAACLVLSAAALSGSAVVSLQGCLAALSSAAAAAMSWWFIHPHDRVSVARLVDSRANMHGAVITAYEREIAEDRRPLSRELSRRTVAKLDLGELRRSILRGRIGLLAVPCVCFGLWSIAVEAVARRTPAGDVAALLASIAEEITDIQAVFSNVGSAGQVDARGSREVEKLARLARLARDEARTAPARTPENLRALELQIEKAAASMPEVHELHRLMSRVSSTVDAALMSLEQVAFASRSRLATEVRSQDAAEPNSRVAAESNSRVAAEPNSRVAAEPNSRVAAEPNSRVALEAARREVQDASSRFSVGRPEPSTASSTRSDPTASGSSSEAPPASARTVDHAARASAAGDSAAEARELADDASNPRTATISDESHSTARDPSIASNLDAQNRRDEAGVTASVWWSERYDNVVERWVEMRRTSLNIPR